MDPAFMNEQAENYRRMWLAAERELWGLKNRGTTSLELLKQLRQAQANMCMHNLYTWAAAISEAIKILESL